MKTHPPKRGRCARTKAKPKGPVRFAKTITLKSGRVLHAEDYGLKAFPIRRRRKG